MFVYSHNESLQTYAKHSGGVQLWYLEHVAIPYAWMWTKVIAVGEACLGISFVLGLFVRLSSSLGIFMVVNLHAATGTLLTLSFFGSAWAAFLLAGLLVALLARAGRWGGIDALLAKSNPKGILW